MTTHYGDSLIGDGENVYLCLLDESGSLSVAGVEKRKGGKEENAETISLPKNIAAGQ